MRFRTARYRGAEGFVDRSKHVVHAVEKGEEERERERERLRRVTAASRRSPPPFPRAPSISPVPGLLKFQSTDPLCTRRGVYLHLFRATKSPRRRAHMSFVFRDWTTLVVRVVWTIGPRMKLQRSTYVEAMVLNRSFASGLDFNAKFRGEVPASAISWRFLATLQTRYFTHCPSNVPRALYLHARHTRRLSGAFREKQRTVSSKVPRCWIRDLVRSAVLPPRKRKISPAFSCRSCFSV